VRDRRRPAAPQPDRGHGAVRHGAGHHGPRSRVRARSGGPDVLAGQSAGTRHLGVTADTAPTTPTGPDADPDSAEPDSGAIRSATDRFTAGADTDTDGASAVARGTPTTSAATEQPAAITGEPAIAGEPTATCRKHVPGHRPLIVLCDAACGGTRPAASPAPRSIFGLSHRPVAPAKAGPWDGCDESDRVVLVFSERLQW